MKVENRYTNINTTTNNNSKSVYYQNPFLGQQKFDEVTLSKVTSDIDSKVVKNNKPFLKRMAAYLCGGLLTLGGATSCTESTPRVSDSEMLDNVKVQYFNVEKETRDSIMTPLITLKSKLTSENDFLKGVEVDVTKTYEDLDNGNSFRRFLKAEEYTDLDKGCSFYSDKNLKRRIVIQEGAHGAADKALYGSVTGQYTALPSMRQSLMHEVGHQFDQFFGHDHNADFALKWDSIVADKARDPNMNPYTLEVKPQDMDARVDYFWNSALSDKPEFQDAILKDFEHVANLKKQKSKYIACNIDYYTDGIDFAKKITPEMVDLAEFARTEVYANLFSYAMGQRDGDERDFLDNFKNAYRVVKKDIKEHLHIDVDAGMKVLKKVR